VRQHEALHWRRQHRRRGDARADECLQEDDGEHLAHEAGARLSLPAGYAALEDGQIAGA
jgi:hypothetical protein